jgi:hypothetical protein
MGIMASHVDLTSVTEGLQAARKGGQLTDSVLFGPGQMTERYQALRLELVPHPHEVEHISE